MRNLLVLALGLALFGQSAFAHNHHHDRYRNRDRERQEQQDRPKIPPQDVQQGQLPECVGSPQVNNDQVLKWKTSTQSGFTARALVMGVLVAILTDQGAHLHLEIDLGNQSSGRANHLEVIYNKQFGETPPLRVGMQVEACGDYITSTQVNNGYPPSPVGAIIHWIHMSPKPDRHPSGFLVIDGKLTGMNDPHDRPHW
jgi:hypothetical protein